MRKSKRNYKSEILDIVKTKDWDRARYSSDQNLYRYIKRHKDTDENCRIIWEHIRLRDFESEVSEIVETKDWDRAKRSNDINLYSYIFSNKDTDENCRIIWEHIKTSHYTIKDYLQYYFKCRKPKYGSRPYNWFFKQIKKGDQCAIDIKNLIVAADTYKDPVALETLDLIKNHLENKEGD